MGKGIERVFLGWDGPLLHGVRDWLRARAGGGGARRLGSADDYSGYSIILPGARAGRRLLELLTVDADGKACVVIPPSVMTMGAWTGLGARLGSASAGTMARLAGWAAALRALSKEERQALGLIGDADEATGGAPPAWISLGRLIDSSHGELCGEAIRFGEVLGRAPSAEGFIDARRWEALTAAQRHYERILRGAGLVDAGLAALEGVERGETDARALAGGGTVVVAGVSEMNAMARRTLDAVSDQCVALVPAPRELADRFDEYGCVIPAKWQEVRIDLPEGSVIAAEGPEEQAAAALRVVERITKGAGAGGAGGAGGAPADAITIGAPDPEVEGRLRRLAGRLVRVPLRRAEGTPVLSTRPVKLLLAIAQFLDDRDFRTFAALVRHPDLEEWIAWRRRKSDKLLRPRWLPILDAYQTEHLHERVDGTWLTEDEDQSLVLEMLHAGVTELLGKGAGGVGGAGGGGGASLLEDARREPAAWSGRVWDVIRNVYSGAGAKGRAADHQSSLFSELNGDAVDVHQAEATREACFAIQARLVELASLPPDLGAALRLSPAEFIRLVLLASDEDSIPEPGEETAIDLVGWLELPADDAPWVLATGMNEGIVPAAPATDPLIPESLRRSLGLRDRASRLARDAFAMLRIVRSRPAGNAVFIFGRRSAGDDPLAPSRLLLACDDASLQARVRLWTGAGGAGGVGGAGGAAEPSALMFAPAESSGFDVSPGALSRIGGRAVKTMSVTSFRHYIESPLGFYLRYVVGLKEVDDAGVEMDALAFGNLMHETVCKLVDADLGACEDPQRVAEFLFANLRAAANLYGDEPRAEVGLQLIQARARLEAFAQEQAKRAAEGWRIVRTEWSPQEGAAYLDVDGEKMFLSGRIDRIDVNVKLNKWAILDYKTANKKPEMKTARSTAGEWLDPQLPLYRRLVRPLMEELGLTGEPVLGWVALPGKYEDAGFVDATWSPAELAAADDRLAQIVRDVRAGKFDLTGDRPPGDGVFGWLCGGLEREESDE